MGVTIAVAATTTTALTGTTAAVSAADPSCPAAVRVASLADGQTVNGLTVHEGITPAPFTGEVLGVLNDGIAPGLDMIMVRLTSTEIDRVGGIWAGMSGSPVYAGDGRLIGAVAYGLAAGPSPVAGVTPAVSMRQLLSSTRRPGALGSPSATAEKTLIPRSTRRELVARGDATAAQAAGGFSRLPVPLGISGMTTQRRLNKSAKMLHLDNVTVFKAGRAAATADATPIVPGGNLAASVSYGDLSAVGVGTATAVCGDEVLAFGHPMLWSGPSTLTMHGADAIFVQEDPTLFPFKVANPTGPVGTINQDRLAALHGVLGARPATTRAHSVVSSQDTGVSRRGETFISVPTEVPSVGALHLLVNQDRVFDGFGKGSANVSWTIIGTRANGRPFRYSRQNRFANNADISFEPVFDILNQLSVLNDNRFGAVKIEDIGIRSQMRRAFRSFTVSKLQRKVDGAWRPVRANRRLAVRPGRILRLQVTMSSFRNELGTKVIRFRIPVPHVREGTPGGLSILGGNSDFGFGGPPVGSFDGLLDQLANAPRNDDLTVQLVLFGFNGRAVQRERTASIGDVVGGGVELPVVVRRR